MLCEIFEFSERLPKSLKRARRRAIIRGLKQGTLVDLSEAKGNMVDSREMKDNNQKNTIETKNEHKKKSSHEFKLVTYDQISTEQSATKLSKHDSPYPQITIQELSDSFPSHLFLPLINIIREYMEYKSPFFGNIQIPGSPDPSFFVANYVDRNKRIKSTDVQLARKRAKTGIYYKSGNTMLQISHPQMDVERRCFVSEDREECIFIDGGHFAVVFDHRVDIYHVGDKLTRVSTIRSQGDYRYSFELKNGSLYVYPVYRKSSDFLARIKLFPLVCCMCDRGNNV